MIKVFHVALRGRCTHSEKTLNEIYKPLRMSFAMSQDLLEGGAASAEKELRYFETLKIILLAK